MRSNHTTEPPMKMPRSSGWKTRVQSVLLAALCGVAAITPHESLDGVVARADGALFRGSQAGRNRVSS